MIKKFVHSSFFKFFISFSILLLAVSPCECMAQIGEELPNYSHSSSNHDCCGEKEKKSNDKAKTESPSCDDCLLSNRCSTDLITDHSLRPLSLESFHPIDLDKSLNNLVLPAFTALVNFCEIQFRKQVDYSFSFVRSSSSFSVLLHRWVV